MILWFLAMRFGNDNAFWGQRLYTHLVVSSLCARGLWKQVEDLVTLTMCGAKDVSCHSKSRCYLGKE